MIFVPMKCSQMSGPFLQLRGIGRYIRYIINPFAYPFLPLLFLTRTRTI